MPPPCPPVLQKLVVLVVSGEESDVVKGTAAIVLARLLLHNSSFFAHFISSPPMAALLHGKAGAPLLLYVDEWLDKVNQSTGKGSYVGVCCLLRLPMPHRLMRVGRWTLWLKWPSASCQRWPSACCSP